MPNHNRVTKLMLAFAVTLILGLVGYSAATASAAEAATDTAGDPWEAAAQAGDAEDGERVIGRVVGVRGRVYAQTPGDSRRLLVENSPIFPGDRIVTSRGTQIGVLSGEYYTGLNENTTLVYSKRGSGAPEVKLERGDVRVVNGGGGAAARVETPGMVAAAAGPDVSAYAVEEKAWVVSLVCALEGQVNVAGAGQALTVDEGGCAASQPGAGLFAAGAAPAALGVAGAAAGSGGGEAGLRSVESAMPPVGAGPLAAAMAAGAGAAAGLAAGGAGMPPVGAAGPRFADPVADGPPGTTTLFVDARPAIQNDLDALNITQPCDRPGSCVTQTGLPGNITPINPWVPGVLPGQN